MKATWGLSPKVVLMLALLYYATCVYQFNVYNTIMNLDPTTQIQLQWMRRDTQLCTRVHTFPHSSYDLQRIVNAMRTPPPSGFDVTCNEEKPCYISTAHVEVEGVTSFVKACVTICEGVLRERLRLRVSVLASLRDNDDVTVGNYLATHFCDLTADMTRNDMCTRLRDTARQARSKSAHVTMADVVRAESADIIFNSWRNIEDFKGVVPNIRLRKRGCVKIDPYAPSQRVLLSNDGNGWYVYDVTYIHLVPYIQSIIFKCEKVQLFSRRIAEHVTRYARGTPRYLRQAFKSGWQR